MEIVDPKDVGKHHHALLAWLGLEEPPPDADSWVPVVKGIPLENRRAKTSTVAKRLVHALAHEGIEAHQRLHEFYEVIPGRTLPGTSMVTCIAVVVHERDLARAVTIAKEVEARLEQASASSPGPSGISDDELTRLAMESGPPPPD